MKKPSPLNFLSTWEYVSAFDQWAQKQRKGYSQRNFAIKANVKSPNFLSLIISRKRNLKGEWLNKFIQASQMLAAEEAHLRKLSDFENAKSTQVRERILTEIRDHLSHSDFAPIAGDQLEVLSEPNAWTLYHMLDLIDMNPTPSWFKKRLRFLKLDSTQIDDAMKTLQRLSLIEKKQGRYQSKEKQLISPDQIKNMANASYHKKILEEASEVLNELTSDERAFGSMTATVAREKITDLKKEINKFGQYLTSKYASKNSVDGEVFRVNIQLYPLTQKNSDEELK